MMTGSMTIAAELLQITQPAVSRLVKDLEKELKFRLFRRDRNRLIPTQEGTTLFAEVDRYYFGIDRIAKIATELQTTRAGSLRIAAMGGLSLSCIPEAISRFREGRSAVNVTVESLNSVSILELVAGRHFDVGFAQVGGEFPGVDLKPLPPVEAVCVAPAEYDIATKPSIEIEDLKDLPFISLGKNSPFRLRVDQAFEVAGVSRQLLLETSLSASVIGLVASGLGVSIVDPFTAATFANGRFAIRPFSPRLTFDVSVITPSHFQNSKLCDEFSNIMRGLFRAMEASPVGA